MCMLRGRHKKNKVAKNMFCLMITSAVVQLRTQEGRWAEATRFYEPIGRAAAADLIAVPAIVLANLCACYIMANNNRQAEALMQKVEEAEDKALLQVWVNMYI